MFLTHCHLPSAKGFPATLTQAWLSRALLARWSCPVVGPLRRNCCCGPKEQFAPENLNSPVSLGKVSGQAREAGRQHSSALRLAQVFTDVHTRYDTTLDQKQVLHSLHPCQALQKSKVVSRFVYTTEIPKTPLSPLLPFNSSRELQYNLNNNKKKTVEDMV